MILETALIRSYYGNNDARLYFIVMSFLITNYSLQLSFHDEHSLRYDHVMKAFND